MQRHHHMQPAGLLEDSIELDETVKTVTPTEADDSQLTNPPADCGGAMPDASSLRTAWERLRRPGSRATVSDLRLVVAEAARLIQDALVAGQSQSTTLQRAGVDAVELDFARSVLSTVAALEDAQERAKAHVTSKGESIPGVVSDLETLVRTYTQLLALDERMRRTNSASAVASVDLQLDRQRLLVRPLCDVLLDKAVELKFELYEQALDTSATSQDQALTSAKAYERCLFSLCSQDWWQQAMTSLKIEVPNSLFTDIGLGSKQSLETAAASDVRLHDLPPTQELLAAVAPSSEIRATTTPGQAAADVLPRSRSPLASLAPAPVPTFGAGCGGGSLPSEQGRRPRDTFNLAPPGVYATPPLPTSSPGGSVMLSNGATSGRQSPQPQPRPFESLSTDALRFYSGEILTANGASQQLDDLVYSLGESDGAVLSAQDSLWYSRDGFREKVAATRLEQEGSLRSELSFSTVTTSLHDSRSAIIMKNGKVERQPSASSLCSSVGVLPQIQCSASLHQKDGTVSFGVGHPGHRDADLPGHLNGGSHSRESTNLASRTPPPGSPKSKDRPRMSLSSLGALAEGPDERMDAARSLPSAARSGAQDAAKASRNSGWQTYPQDARRRDADGSPVTGDSRLPGQHVSFPAGALPCDSAATSIIGQTDRDRSDRQGRVDTRELQHNRSDGSLNHAGTSQRDDSRSGMASRSSGRSQNDASPYSRLGQELPLGKGAATAASMQRNGATSPVRGQSSSPPSRVTLNEFWRAVGVGDLRAVKDFTRQGHCNGTTRDGGDHSVLWHSIAFKHLDVAVFMVETFPPGSAGGIDIGEIHARRGDTLLHLLCQSDAFSAETANLFSAICAAAPASLMTAKNKDGYKFLQFAAARLNFWVLKFMLHNHADIALKLFSSEDTVPLQFVAQKVLEPRPPPAAQITPVPQSLGLAMLLDGDEAGRVPFADVAFDVGPDASDGRQETGSRARFLAHRAVIAGQSPVLLAAMLGLQLQALPHEGIYAGILRVEPAIPTEVWKSVLQFLYTGIPSCPFEHEPVLMAKLLLACVLYELPAALSDHAQGLLFELLPRNPPELSLDVFLTCCRRPVNDAGLRPIREASSYILLRSAPQALAALSPVDATIVLQKLLEAVEYNVFHPYQPAADVGDLESPVPAEPPCAGRDPASKPEAQQSQTRARTSTG
eukprot:TRINITY_DN26593_c0_g1_i3.p1 TRINITY_DN26593_c0_g1~~TRINITY_DN26593_c0_g1_i3.p1  ORF type:complete len:1180 (+),score=198.17 TRINITY_DN26593_c0_g1_i3:179-3718(+)